MFRCCPLQSPFLSLLLLPLSFSTAVRVHSCSEYRHYRSVKIISSANLQLGKTRKLWKIQRCWQPPSLPALLSHLPISISVSLSFHCAFFYFRSFFLIFHLLLLSPALAFIHRANYALQCVAVAIVPPAQTPQLISAVYILSLSFSLYIYVYALFCILYLALPATSKVKDGVGALLFGGVCRGNMPR